MKITLADYFGSHDKSKLTPDNYVNASTTVVRANTLLERFGEDRIVNSGWRPAEYNAGVPNASQTSKHITCQAIDLADPEGDLDEWCFDHPEVLVEIGLWQEHPAATPHWVHIQVVPPKSGKRVFYP